jgi:hypothetical protein
MLTKRGIRIEFVKEGLHFAGEDSPMANLLLSVMGAFAEFERALIRERQREGIALAKKRGAYRGRKKALAPEQVADLRQPGFLTRKITHRLRNPDIISFAGIIQEQPMQTECNSQRILFQELGRREVVADFQGGNITSDAGGLLLGDINRGRQVIERFARCFTDFRSHKRIDHKLKELLAQRIYGIALGYEDLNDHDRLRCDPLLAALVGKTDPLGESRGPGLSLLLFDFGREFRNIPDLFIAEIKIFQSKSEKWYN